MSQSTSRPTADMLRSSKDRPPPRGVLLKTTIPGPNAKKIIAADARYLQTTTKSSPIVAASASGVWVTDVDGNRFLDFTAGVSVVNTGHCHPAIVRAIHDQSSR